MKTLLGSGVGLCVLLLCGACGESPEGKRTDADQPSQGELVGTMSFQLKASPDEMNGVKIQILRDDQLIAEKYVGLEQESLPVNLAPGGLAGHGFADGYFVLAPGKYLVRATPMKSPDEPSASCALAETNVEVFPNQTTEVVLVSKCAQQDNGGLDVIVTTEHAPILTDLVLSPSKFILTCEALSATVSVAEPDNEPLNYHWEILEKPADASFEISFQGNTLSFMSRSAGDYQVQVTACDSGNLCTSLKFPIHVSMSNDTDHDGLGDECEPGPQKKGRIVTLLLTLSNPRTLHHPTKDIPLQLSTNTIGWVSPVPAPAIAVVRDDNHRNEFFQDPEFVRSRLQQAGFAADLIEEPADGLTWDLVKGYQVLWFSNPGWKVDDPASVEVMKRWVEEGRGLVLQGDDMSWLPSMQPLTHLQFEDNGEHICGKWTNDNLGASYMVSIEQQSHPVIQGLESVQFLYGDDIDHSRALGQGEVVLATATLNPADRCDPAPCTRVVPVVVAYDPN